MIFWPLLSCLSRFVYKLYFIAVDSNILFAVIKNKSGPQCERIKKDFVRIIYDGEEVTSDGLQHSEEQFSIYEVIEESPFKTVALIDGNDSIFNFLLCLELIFLKSIIIVNTIL